MPSFSFIVPTAGRSSIKNCLLSIVPQLTSDDEVLVVGDTTDGDLPDTEYIVGCMPANVRYLTYAGSDHSWGHDQINLGIAQAAGEWLSFNDDDDVWVPGIAVTLRQVASEYPYTPLLFRYLAYVGYLSWTVKGVFREGYIGGHSLVCPNTPEKLGTWTSRYEGDWDFVQTTASFYNRIIWRDEVIAIARPDKEILAEIYRLSGMTL
jgi:glycosyltransferase involved in cell wall biosynthesis